MGASWNPYSGVVLSEKKLSKQEVSQLKGQWLAHHYISVGAVAKLWKKFKMVIILLSHLK